MPALPWCFDVDKRSNHPIISLSLMSTGVENWPIMVSKILIELEQAGVILAADLLNDFLRVSLHHTADHRNPRLDDSGFFMGN